MGFSELLAEAQLGPRPTEGVGLAEVAAVATSLKICVLEQGRAVIQVSFPAFAIVNLADLVPDEVKPNIVEHDLDLEELAARFAARGCPPGELFSLPGRRASVRAWME
jgi:hypothetical protein